MKSEKIAHLERRLGYEFSDKGQLALALTHRSCGSRNNERLEFLGDSIVNFIIAEALYEQFPDAREGQLSRLRARMVRGATLAELGREFELGDFLRLGSGELKSGGYRRESILADAVEAIIGAIYLDAGMETCRSRVRSWFEQRLAVLSTTDQQNKDPKTRLQEFLQARQKSLPLYRVSSITGEAHDQVFTVVCELDCLDQDTLGEGPSRRGAEQQAARKALKLLGITP
ncbi:ribonuclease III [Endozoicomonas sp. Mp262]|uniref:ribonuclease III n=1 Tax=Endozoicomonas sp. Mp262 TaxID=2919499 RepID=UPI0021D8E68F